MHDLLLEALLAHPTLSTAAIRDVAETSGSAIDQMVPLAIPAPSVVERGCARFGSGVGETMSGWAHTRANICSDR